MKSDHPDHQSFHSNRSSRSAFKRKQTKRENRRRSSRARDKAFALATPSNAEEKRAELRRLTPSVHSLLTALPLGRAKPIDQKTLFSEDTENDGDETARSYGGDGDHIDGHDLGNRGIDNSEPNTPTATLYGEYGDEMITVYDGYPDLKSITGILNRPTDSVTTHQESTVTWNSFNDAVDQFALHKRAVGRECPGLFATWTRGAPSFLHYAQSMIPQCYDLVENPQSVESASLVRYEVDIACACSYLSQIRCTQSAFCTFDWVTKICVPSSLTFSLEYFLRVKDRGYRAEPYKACSESLVPLSLDDDVSCDVQDMLAEKIMATKADHAFIHAAMMIGFFCLLTMGVLMSLRGRFIAQWAVSMHLLLILLLIYLGLNCSGVFSFPFVTLYEQDYLHTDSSLVTTYRSNAALVEGGPQDLIVDESSVWLSDDYRSCRPSGFQEQSPSLNQLTHFFTFILLDHKFWSSLIAIVLCYSNVGTGIKVHHGSITPTTVFGRAGGLIHAGSVLPIMIFSTHAMSMYSMQQLGSNIYENPYSSLNQDWWLRVEFPTNFHAILSTLWTAGLIAAENYFLKPTRWCEKTFEIVSNLFISWPLRFVMTTFCYIECVIYVAHFIHSIFGTYDCPEESSKDGLRPRFPSWFDRQINGEPTYASEDSIDPPLGNSDSTHPSRSDGIPRLLTPNKVSAIIIFLFAVLSLLGYFVPNLNWVGFQSIYFIVGKFVTPLFVIVLIIAMFWARDRNLAKGIIGSSAIRVKENVYWFSLAVATFAPVAIDILNVTIWDYTFPSPCPVGWYTCQMLIAYAQESPSDTYKQINGFSCPASFWLTWVFWFVFLFVNVLVLILLTLNRGMRLLEVKDKMKVTNYSALADILERCITPRRFGLEINTGRLTDTRDTKPSPHDSITPHEFSSLVNSMLPRGHDPRRGVLGLTRIQTAWWLICGQGRLSLYSIGLLEGSQFLSTKIQIAKDVGQNMLITEALNMGNFWTCIFMYLVPAVMAFIIQQGLSELIYLQVNWMTHAVKTAHDMFIIELIPTLLVLMTITTLSLIIMAYAIDYTFHTRRSIKQEHQLALEPEELELKRQRQSMHLTTTKFHYL